MKIIRKIFSIKSCFHLFAFSLFGLVTACGGGDGEQEVNIDYSNLKMAPIKNEPLNTTTPSAFERYLKNGIRLRFNQTLYTAVPLAEASADGSGTQSRFSTTNVHEIGVDEDDRLKYDGEFMYLMEDGYFPLSVPERQQRIRIMQTDPQSATANEVAMIENSGDNLPFSGMYLHELANSDYLVTLSASQFFAWDAIFVDADWRWGSGKTAIQIHDVSNPGDPQLDWQIEIEGNLEGSRKIGNKLYLITHYVPNIETLNNGAQTDEEKRANEILILNTPISDLLPHYQINDGGIRSLVAPEDCFVAGQVDPDEGYADVITVTSIDLDSRSIESSSCLNANVHGIYSSPESLYIGASGNVVWSDIGDGTAFHKFALTQQGIDYRGTGWTKGRLGWSDPAFRMSEHDGYLRTVTTAWTGVGPRHMLTVFEESGNDELSIVSTLPNEDNPALIGKPGEDIFAVRFVEDNAYVITFMRIDPLYKINLSDPLEPFIEAELEMPGFARYLHPLAEGWLLGVGQNVESNVPSGLKLELYDLRNASQLLVKDTVILGEQNTWSEALSDIRAMSFLEISSNTRQLTLPVDRYGRESPTGPSGWIDSGLHVFEISGFNSGELTLSHTGAMITESKDQGLNYPRHWGSGRSTITTDSIYFYRGNELWSALQGDLSSILGPH